MNISSRDITSILDKMKDLELDFNSNYLIDEKRIPRVTEILSAMLHNDSLLNWSNSLGWKRISYKTFMQEAADKGTYSHLAVEKYIKNNGKVNLKELNIPNEKIYNTVISVLDAFDQWWNKLHIDHKDIEIIFIEETLLHRYFGGTCDCLLKVDGKYWLIDFKTSNHMSYNYSLQLAAYRFLLRELKGINIDKTTILMLDKENHSYKEYNLNLAISEHLNFIDDCEQTFLLLVAAYRMRLYTTEEYKVIFNVPF